jgi:uncharacterized protein YjiS (DUF1127 family)
VSCQLVHPAPRDAARCSLRALLRLLAEPARYLIRRARRRRRARETYRALHQLNDRMLKDIGLHRSQICSVEAGRCDPRGSDAP